MQKHTFISDLLFWMYSVTPSKLKYLIVKIILKIEGKGSGYMYSKTIRRIYKEKYHISIGYGTYGGCFTSPIPPNVIFGNYCSIAANIRIFRANHPKNEFTTHPLLCNPIAGYVKEDRLERPTLTIGNDVWIGEWSIILPSVSYIGNRAIIGAGSIVTKNVEPYAIVAGNPAKKIGERFNKDLIIKIEKSQWWNLEKDELIKNIDSLNKIIK